MPHESQARMIAGAETARLAFDHIYTPRELAELWQLSENSIRRLFVDEPGVFVLGESNPRRKRGYTTLRIPESVAARVFNRRSQR